MQEIKIQKYTQNNSKFNEPYNEIFKAVSKHEIIESNISFHFYIYPSDSQESDGGATHRGKQLPSPASEIPKYSYLLESFCLFF